MFNSILSQHAPLTEPKHPWINGQVERMNRTLKEATVKRYHHGSHAQLGQHLHAFLMAYNFARRLKALKGLTPYQYICGIWQKEPHRFAINPCQFSGRVNNYHHVMNMAGKKHAKTHHRHRRRHR